MRRRGEKGRGEEGCASRVYREVQNPAGAGESCLRTEHKAKPLSLVAKAVGTQGKGGVLVAKAVGTHKAKAVSYRAPLARELRSENSGMRAGREAVQRVDGVFLSDADALGGVEQEEEQEQEEQEEQAEQDQEDEEEMEEEE